MTSFFNELPFAPWSSKWENFKNAQIRIKKNSKSLKLAKKLESQSLINLRWSRSEIWDLNFLTVWLSLGNQCFGPNANVNSICFKSNVCIVHKHDLKHLLRPKKVMNHYRKILCFRIIWIYFVTIDLWSLFGTQILLLNPLVSSKKRHNKN